MDDKVVKNILKILELKLNLNCCHHCGGDFDYKECSSCGDYESCKDHDEATKLYNETCELLDSK